jgi:hypothetical protein
VIPKWSYKSGAGAEAPNPVMPTKMPRSPSQRSQPSRAAASTATKKPSPEVFEIALRQLRLHASCCVAFEDSSNGVIGAQRARLKVIATPSAYFSDDDFTGAHSVISHLGEPHHAHRHLAGWSWPGDFVTLAALHAWSEKISA